ncbi:MAG: NERD domain-containing protein [Verrucomicrobia bacterium]|nr:NERD domain-containing protein [Verrucomicrobiota bacterium]
MIYLSILPIACFIVGYAIGAYRKWSVENSGEALVRQSLEKYCKNKDAHVLNCVTLRLEDGSTTQIDHILVSTKGIFVIETKHYKGWIFGNPKSKLWTQIIYKNKHTFQNPLFQNFKHIKAIQHIFDFLEPQLIHNIVVFSGEATFKTPKIDNVCYIEDLIPTIENYSDDALTLNRVQFCVGRLEYMRLELTQETDVEHHAYLKQKFGR